jgi:hypothetical protein
VLQCCHMACMASYWGSRFQLSKLPLMSCRMVKVIRVTIHEDFSMEMVGQVSC